MIKVKDLHKTYFGKVPTMVLKGINFDVEKGEFVAIMGKSGSGKSTLLHQLGLFDVPSKGEIYYDNELVSDFSEREKNNYRLNKLGYVFQEYALLPELSVIESVYLPLKMQGEDQSNYLFRAKESLDMVGLSHRMSHMPNELSGGEQQRVAIARAIVGRPKILFADEPCANLDSESSAMVVDLFRKLNKELGQTIVMVTHEPDDAKKVDRVIKLKDGVVINEDKYI